MSSQTVETWIAESHDVETRFDSKDQVVAHLRGLEEQASGRVYLRIDRGPVTGWRRLLSSKRNVTPCFAAEWDSGFASLIFLDGIWSEYRAIDGDHPVSPSEEIRRNIAHGEPHPHPIGECMEKVRAFAAMQDYVRQGRPPEWLTYRCVR